MLPKKSHIRIMKTITATIVRTRGLEPGMVKKAKAKAMVRKSGIMSPFKGANLGELYQVV